MRSLNACRSRQSCDPSLFVSGIHVFWALRSGAITRRKNTRRSSTVFIVWISGSQSGCSRMSSNWPDRGDEVTNATPRLSKSMASGFATIWPGAQSVSSSPSATCAATPFSASAADAFACAGVSRTTSAGGSTAWRAATPPPDSGANKVSAAQASDDEREPGERSGHSIANHGAVSLGVDGSNRRPPGAIIFGMWRHRVRFAARDIAASFGTECGRPAAG